jgi:hypothetical protein
MKACRAGEPARASSGLERPSSCSTLPGERVSGAALRGSMRIGCLFRNERRFVAAITVNVFVAARSVRLQRHR